MKTLSVFLLLALSASAQPGPTDRDLVRASMRIRRLALVIGNDAYPGNPLHNAVNDARGMKSALEQSGFKVQLGLNVTQRQMESVIDEFTGGVKPGDVALFFYAGHGMQISDQNYLVPVDFEARTAVDAKYKAYPAQRVQENLEAAGAGMQILVLDACRNNPFRSWRGGSDGLAAMQAGRGTYIAFATSPGKTAEDNPSGQNGLFTGELIAVLRETGFSIDQVFNRVRERVTERSHGQQLPWSTSSVTGEFYFKVTVEVSHTVPAPTRDPSAERELAFWNSVKDETDASLLEEYLQKYPQGEFASIAKSKLNRMKAAATPLAPVDSPVLANGDPPLTEAMVDAYNNFEAWLFELPRTQQQRDRVRAMMIEDWKKPAEIKNDMASLSLAAQIAQATPDQQEFVRCQLQPKNLESLRADKNNPDALRLLAAYEQSHQPIAPGDPPLTESMVSRFTSYLGWVLQIRLTQPLKDNLRAALLQDWKQPREIKSDMDFLNWQVDMANRPNEEKEYFRSRAEPEIIKAMRADRGNPAAPWIVAAYDAAHPAIAPGNPPLTRQAADAFTELLCFIRNQGGGPRQEANQALKDNNAQLLAQNYPKLSSEQQQKLAQMPQNWAMLRLAWRKGSEADRQKIVAQWQPLVQPSQQPSPQTAPGREAALAALRRIGAFLEKDARTVSEQEMLTVAKDCDFVAQEWRREGNLEGAPAWEQTARNLRAGKAAYLKQLADQQTAASVQADPRSVEGHKSEARYIAFKKKDPNTVSEQELLQTATDCDIVAKELRREGGEANAANALTWDQASRNLRSGKAAWVKQWDLERAQEAGARYNAFMKRDANTVSDQDLAAAAKDALIAAEYSRRHVDQQALAASWEQAARSVSVGREAWVKQRANSGMTAEQFQYLWNAEEKRFATSMNIIGNMSSSGFHYEVRH